MGNGKEQVRVLLRHRRRKSTKYSRVAILNCSHRGINDRFSGQSVPRKTELWPAFSVMERTGVMELFRPMRAFKVKFARTLRDPGTIGEQRGWVLPVGFDSSPLHFRYQLSVTANQHLRKFRDALAVSFSRFRCILVRPTINTERRIPRIIEVKCVC